MKPILPGSTIGVLGSGQLGRMFAMAARQMGYRVHTFSPDTDTPTGQIADVEVSASYDDLDAVRAFARDVDAVTFEFENVPSATAAAIEALVPVRPSGNVLHTTQHRIREKTFLQSAGIPVAPFRIVRSLADLNVAIEQLGCPCILKTAGFGYDGKGQARIDAPSSAEAAWQSLKTQEAVLEGFVDFESELSVVAARTHDGQFAHYGLVENRHHRHILDFTIAPAIVEPSVLTRAEEIARTILEQLNVIGVLCVELFLTRDHHLLVNELAPRPHNSGHFTIDACVSSQFEQQLRTVCGLPLGSTEQLRPAAMANLLGDLWESGTPDWAAACAIPGINLHLYGKLETRVGRKMGHLTALAATPEAALESARRAREVLTASRQQVHA